MASDDFNRAFKAGGEAVRQMPFWLVLMPFFAVGVVDLVSAVAKHELRSGVVSALLWCVAAPAWVWWTRGRR